MIINERAERLSGISSFKADKYTPLVREYGIYSHYYRLHNLIKIYIEECLYQYYHTRFILSGENWLNDSKQIITDLPNITPNGLVLPKVGTIFEYNMIIKEIVSILENTGIQNIDKVYCPINIRIVNGTPNYIKDNRPRSSTKPHVDIWAGEFTNSCMVHIPIAGNMDKNGMSLYEPGESFFPRYVRTFDDFNDAQDCLLDAQQYDLKMQKGNLYFTDSFVLHKTNKQEPGLRLIASFTMLYKNKVSSDIDIKTNRYNDFMDFEDWKQVGITKLVKTNKRMEKYIETNEVSNMYADQLEVVSL